MVAWDVEIVSLIKDSGKDVLLINSYLWVL